MRNTRTKYKAKFSAYGRMRDRIVQRERAEREEREREQKRRLFSFN